jgi:hypothetical protein
MRAAIGSLAGGGLMAADVGKQAARARQSADSPESPVRRTEGWAAGIGLAAIAMGTHARTDQFVMELTAG